MAKVNGVSKKLLAKKDMNFFAEFTANAAKAARMLGYGVAIGVLVVFVVLAFIVAFIIRNQLIKNQIKALRDLLASPDYATLEQEYAMLTEKLNEMTNYYFALTQMRRDVDEIDPAPTELPDVIAKCIPSDSFVSSYTITSDQLTMTGYAFTYYSAVDMVNMLNEKDVFTARPIIQASRVEPFTESTFDDVVSGESIDATNNYYSFSISGTLVSNVHISISRYVDGAETATSLGGIETKSVRAGDSYSINNVNTYTYGGVTYYLTRIYVDGIQVEDASFALIKEANQYVDVGRGNIDIKLYYSTSVAEQAPAEG